MKKYVEERPSKVNINDIYVIFPIKQNCEYIDTGSYHKNKKIYEVKNEITVGFNKKIVYRDEINSIDTVFYRYVDLISLDTYYVKDNISSSEKYSSINPKEHNEEYGLPVSLKRMAELYNIDINDDYLLFYDIKDIFKKINYMDKDRAPITLSFNCEEAKVQIESIINPDDEISNIYEKNKGLK